MPLGAGLHTKFEADEEEQENAGGSALRGLPVFQGKHTRFEE